MDYHQLACISSSKEDANSAMTRSLTFDFFTKETTTLYIAGASEDFMRIVE